MKRRIVGKTLLLVTGATFVAMLGACGRNDQPRSTDQPSLARTTEKHGEPAMDDRIVSFNNGIRRDLGKIPAPWTQDHIDSYTLKLQAPGEALGVIGNGADYPEQQIVTLIFSQPGNNLLEPSLNAFRNAPTDSLISVQDYPTLAGAYGRYANGNNVVVMTRDRSLVASCPGQNQLDSLPNPYCIALLYSGAPNEVIVLSLSAYALDRLPALAELANTLSKQLAVDE